MSKGAWFIAMVWHRERESAIRWALRSAAQIPEFKKKSLINSLSEGIARRPTVLSAWKNDERRIGPVDAHRETGYTNSVLQATRLLVSARHSAVSARPGNLRAQDAALCERDFP
jgi:hypothetical protein